MEHKEDEKKPPTQTEQSPEKKKIKTEGTVKLIDLPPDIIGELTNYFGKISHFLNFFNTCKSINSILQSQVINKCECITFRTSFDKVMKNKANYVRNLKMKIPANTFITTNESLNKFGMVKKLTINLSLISHLKFPEAFAEKVEYLKITKNKMIYLKGNRNHQAGIDISMFKNLRKIKTTDDLIHFFNMDFGKFKKLKEIKGFSWQWQGYKFPKEMNLHLLNIYSIPDDQEPVNITVNKLDITTFNNEYELSKFFLIKGRIKLLCVDDFNDVLEVLQQSNIDGIDAVKLTRLTFLAEEVNKKLLDIIKEKKSITKLEVNDSLPIANFFQIILDFVPYLTNLKEFIFGINLELHKITELLFENLKGVKLTISTPTDTHELFFDEKSRICENDGCHKFEENKDFIDAKFMCQEKSCGTVLHNKVLCPDCYSKLEREQTCEFCKKIFCDEHLNTEKIQFRDDIYFCDECEKKHFPCENNPEHCVITINDIGAVGYKIRCKYHDAEKFVVYRENPSISFQDGKKNRHPKKRMKKKKKKSQERQSLLANLLFNRGNLGMDNVIIID